MHLAAESDRGDAATGFGVTRGGGADQRLARGGVRCGNPLVGVLLAPAGVGGDEGVLRRGVGDDAPVRIGYQCLEG